MKQTILPPNHLLCTLAISLIFLFACKNQPSTTPPSEPTANEQPEPAPQSPPDVLAPDTATTPEVTAPPAEDDNTGTTNATESEQVYEGTATYYSDNLQGKNTASGEPYDREKYTAAIRMNAISVPFGTTLEVYSVKRDKKVTVKVNDKMSDRASAIIDLSYAAAEKIGLTIDGRTKVTVRVLPDAQTGATGNW